MAPEAPDREESVLARCERLADDHVIVLDEKPAPGSMVHHKVDRAPWQDAKRRASGPK